MGRFAVLLCGMFVMAASGKRDQFLHMDDTVVQVQNTTNQVVNVTMGEFSESAKHTREAYNAIFPLLKVNHSASDVNILLQHLEEVRKRNEEESRTRAANDTKLADPVVEETWENAVQGKSANLLRNHPHRSKINFPLLQQNRQSRRPRDYNYMQLTVVFRNFLIKN